MRRFLLVFSFLVLILSSCNKHKTASYNSSIENVSFHWQVQPLIESHCINCHSAGSSVELYDYAHVKALANSGQLAGCLDGNINYLQMPLIGTMDSSAYHVFLRWVSQGGINN